MTTMQSIEGVICVRLDFTIWAGRKQLKIEDLKKISGDQIPPGDLASLGSKKICDPADLKIFSTLKSRAQRTCLKVGVKFLGGYAVPQAHIKTVMVELEAIEREYEIATKNFLSNYDCNIDEWMKSHQQWEEIIRTAIEPAHKIKEKLLFSYQAYKVNVASDGDDDLNLGLQTQAEGLGDQLFFEVSQMANKAWEDSYKGKEKVTQKGLWPVNNILDKLNALSFIDVRVGPVVAHIEQVIAEFPKKGAIDGANFSSVAGLLLLLSNTDKMKAHGQQFLNDLQQTGECEEPLETEYESKTESKNDVATAISIDLDVIAHSDVEVPDVDLTEETEISSIHEGAEPPQQDEPAVIAWF